MGLIPHVLSPSEHTKTMKAKNATFTAIAVTTLCMLVYLQFKESQYHDANSKDLTPTVTEQPNATLVVRLMGGLGNHLWLYSALYGLAHKTHRRPVGCYTYDIRRIFSRLPGSVELLPESDCQEGSAVFPRSALKVTERHHLTYDTRLVEEVQRSVSSQVYLCCYLQNLGYWVEHLQQVRTQFVIQPSLQAAAQAYLRALLTQVAAGTNRTLGRGPRGAVLLAGHPPVLVTVHVRRTDLLREASNVQPGPGYFTQAMAVYRNKYGPRVLFLVATDDLKWSKANIQGPDVYFTGEHGMKSREEEFAIAVACNHTIISIGTFGWWMGLLTGGDVVYIQNWVLGSNWKTFYQPHQMFPRSWQGLTLPHPEEKHP